MSQRKRLFSDVADESGWVMVSAIVLTMIMLSIAMVAAAMVDTGTHRTREQRERESALNVDEGVLYAQSLVMQSDWPSGSGTNPVTGKAQYYPVNVHVVAGAAERRSARTRRRWRLRTPRARTRRSSTTSTSSRT